MPKYWVLLLLFCLSFLNVCLSQTVNIEGRIIDSNTKIGISGASVYILDLNDAIIDYVYSDENGTFSIELNKKSIVDGHSIVFSYLGYMEQKNLLRIFKSNTIIELTPTEIPLPEVEIISHPIKEQGDTLIYNVARFKMAQDRSIADVLRNMPGIRVTDEGTIYYQGEPINKFYIEGVDLLDEKYKLASNNLKADYVEYVQVLQQHEPVKSLRGKTFGEQAAINLVLNEGAKQRWLFSVDFGVGLPLTLWDNRLMAMSFGKSAQNLSMYKNNSTGEDIASELSSPATISEIIIDARMPKVERGLFQPSMISSLPMDKKKYQLNASHLITSNQIWKLSEDKNLRYQISYLKNKERQQLDSEVSAVLDVDSTLIIQELKKSNSYQNKLEGELSYTHNADNFYLSNKLSSNIIWAEQHNRIVTHQYDIEEKYNLPQQLLRNDFRIVIPRKKGRLEATSLTQLATLSHFASFQIGDASKTHPYTQEYALKNMTTSNQVSYTFLLNKSQIKHTIGVDFTSQRLNSLSHPPALIDILDHENDAAFKNITSYVETQMGYKSDKLDYYFNLLLKHSSVTIQNKDSLQNGYTFVHFLPSAGLKYYPSNWLTLSLKGQVTDNIADIRTLYPQTIFINYRILNSFTGKPTQSLSHKYVLSLIYRNPVKGFFMEGSAGYSIMKRHLINKTFFIDDLFQQNESLFTKNNIYSPILGISGSKMFGWWNTKLFLNGFYKESEYTYIVQNRQTDFSSKSYSINLGVTIQPRKWFNNEYELRYINNMLAGNDTGNNNFSTSYFQHSLSTYFFPCTNIQVGIKQDLFRTKKVNYYFANFYVLYRFKKMDISVEIRNLTNQTHYVFENVVDFYKSRITRTMRPREIMIKMNLNF